MIPSLLLTALLSCGLTLVRPVGAQALTADEIRNAGWKLSVDEVLEAFFLLLERTTELERLVGKLTTTVAFTVTNPLLTKAEQGMGDVTLKYETIITKLGANYDPTTGIFTVLTPGLYFFTFYFHTNNRREGAAEGLELHVNSNEKVKCVDITAGGDYMDSSGQGLTLNLAKDDEVTVVLKEDMCIFDDPNNHFLNTFSGFLIKPSFTDDDDDADIRLAGGRTTCDGRVEVNIGGQWGTVCDEGWCMNDAAVVCRQLECGTALSASMAAGFGQGQGSIWYSNVACDGTESLLQDCDNDGIGIHTCSHSDDAGVYCSGSVLRLVDGANRCQGRLEVYHGGEWGTVCDNNWDVASGKVVCKQLDCGSYSGNVDSYGQGVQAIVFDEVVCSGTETEFSVCPHVIHTVGSLVCSHANDVQITCTG